MSVVLQSILQSVYCVMSRFTKHFVHFRAKQSKLSGIAGYSAIAPNAHLSHPDLIFLSTTHTDIDKLFYKLKAEVCYLRSTKENAI